MLPLLLSRVENGALRAPVTAVFDLDDIEAAFSALQAGARGKIVLRIP